METERSTEVVWSALSAKTDVPEETAKAAWTHGDADRLHWSEMLANQRQYVNPTVRIRGMLRFAAGILLVIAGTIWMLQGFDIAFAPQSFMTNDRTWVMWGAVAVIGGGVLAWVGWYRK